MLNATLALLLCFCPPQDVLVVGRDAPTLQGTIDAARDGDLVVVRTGPWPSGVISGKGISIIATPGTRPAIERLTIVDLPAGSTVHLRGLRSGSQSMTAWIEATRCSGPILLEDLHTYASAQRFLEASDCVSVQAVGCQMGMGGVVGGQVPSISVRNTRIDLHDSEVIGGSGVEGLGCGFCTWCTNGGPGSNAIEASLGSVVHLARSRVVRGVGGLPYPGSFACSQGPDGYALVGDPSSRFELVDTVVVGNINGAVQTYNGNSGSLTVPHHVGGEATARLEFSGMPGDRVVLLTASHGGAASLAPGVGTLGVGRAGLVRRPLGTIDSSGELVVSLDVPSSDFRGARTAVAQPVFLSPAGVVRLGAPRLLLHVGDRGPIVAAGRTVRVDGRAPSGGDGTSWVNALENLDEAISNAWSLQQLPPVTLWVAAGRYGPPAGPFGPRPFDAPRGVRILGGFSTSMTAESERDPYAYPTVLSADVLDDDGPGFTNRSDNLGSLLRTEYSSALTALPFAAAPSHQRIEVDGFVLSGISATNPYARAASIIDDTALSRITLTDNEVVPGASLVGLRFYYGTYLNNSTLWPPRVDRLHAYGNIGTVLTMRGDIVSPLAPTARVRNTLIVGNRAAGPIIEILNGHAVLENITVADNRLAISGSAVHFVPSSPGQQFTLLHSIVFGNYTSAGAGLSIQLATNALGAGGHRCDLSVIDGWDGVSFAGTGTLASDPLFLDPIGADGQRGTGDEDYRLQAGSPAVDSGDTGRVDPTSVLDLVGLPRIADDPLTQDNGPGAAPHIDRGAYERQ